MEEYTVSTSHVGLRTAGFLLAAVVAVCAFAYGVSRLSYKEPGYYEIVADPSQEAPLSRNGITLVYYFDGKSSEINAGINSLKKLYGAALSRSYMLLDAEETYEGLVNLASLNAGFGQELPVSRELADILADAWEKTLEERGFHLFSGALLREWDSILSLDDMSEFDPAENPDTAERIRALAERTARLDNFSLEIFQEAGTVRVDVSEEYLNFLRENEYQGPVLDIGRLQDAYRLELIRDTLETQGFCRGYLYTDSGLTVSLSDHSEGEYVLYGYDGERVVPCAGIRGEAGGACSFLRTFPMEEGELMYHVFGEGDQGRFYHPNFLLRTGGYANLLTSSCVVCDDGDIVTACYENLTLYQAADTQELQIRPAGARLAYLLREEPGTVYTDDVQGVRAYRGGVVEVCRPGD